MADRHRMQRIELEPGLENRIKPSSAVLNNLNAHKNVFLINLGLYGPEVHLWLKTF